jgi:hypothetical protein
MTADFEAKDPDGTYRSTGSRIVLICGSCAARREIAADSPKTAALGAMEASKQGFICHPGVPMVANAISVTCAACRPQRRFAPIAELEARLKADHDAKLVRDFNAKRLVRVLRAPTTRIYNCEMEGGQVTRRDLSTAAAVEQAIEKRLVGKPIGIGETAFRLLSTVDRLQYFEIEIS